MVQSRARRNAGRRRRLTRQRDPCDRREPSRALLYFFANRFFLVTVVTLLVRQVLNYVMMHLNGQSRPSRGFHP